MQCFHGEAISTTISLPEIYFPLSITTAANHKAVWFGLSSCMRFCLSWTRLSAPFCSSSLRKSGMRWKTIWFELIFGVRHMNHVSHHVLHLPLLVLIHSISFNVRGLYAHNILEYTIRYAHNVQHCDDSYEMFNLELAFILKWIFKVHTVLMSLNEF